MMAGMQDTPPEDPNPLPLQAAEEAGGSSRQAIVPWVNCGSHLPSPALGPKHRQFPARAALPCTAAKPISLAGFLNYTRFEAVPVPRRPLA